MATQVQLRRGSTAQVASFIGAPGELVVNTDTWSLHVMDGATPGGFQVSSAPGSGTVTSINIASANSAISVAGSPVTSSGTITLAANTFTSSAPGVVPASGGGTTNFLRADGLWSPIPSNNGTVTSVSVLGTLGRINSSGSPITNSGVITLDLATTSVVPGNYTNSNVTVDAYGRITNISNGPASGTGTVTSVNVSGAATGLTFTGGPVTTSGTLTIGGTLSISNGGTGQTTAQGAINSLLPSQVGNANRILATNGINVSWVVPSGTNLSSSRDSSTVTIISDTGTDALLASATASLAGILTAEDKIKIDQSAPINPAVITDSTTSRTLSSADNGSIIRFTNTSPISVTIGTSFSGFNCLLVWQENTGPITLISSGTTLNGSANNIILSNSAGSVSIIPTGSPNSFDVLGAIGNSVITDSTTSRTLSSADNGSIIRFTNTSPISVTIGTSFSDLSCVLTWQESTGPITIVPVTGTTLNGSANNIILSNSAGSVSIIPTGSPNSFDVLGAIGNLVSTDISDSTIPGRNLLTASSVSSQQTFLNLVPGTNIQPFNSSLNSIASINGSANQLIYFTGPASVTTSTLSPFSRTLLDDLSDVEARQTLGAAPLQQSVITDNTNLRILTSSDNGQVIRFTNSSPITVRVGTQFSGFACRIIRAGTGSITFEELGTTIDNNNVINVAGGWATLLPASSPNNFNLIGYFSPPSGTGTVTSVNASGGTTGMTFSGGPVTTSGTLLLGGVLSLDNGGTGATSPQDARQNINAAAAQQLTGLSAFIENPVNKEYRILINSPFAWTATSITAVTATGSCTVTSFIGGVAIAGGSVNATSVATSSTMTSNNIINSSNTFSISVTDATSVQDLSLTIAGFRILS